MRQFGADLRRFAARRIVRGALLLVVAIMALVVTLATLAGDEVTPQQQAEFDAQMEAIQNQAPPSTFITEDGMVEGGVAYPDPPTDDRIKVVADLPDGSTLVLTPNFLGDSVTAAVLEEPPGQLALIAAPLITTLPFVAGAKPVNAKFRPTTFRIDDVSLK